MRSLKRYSAEIYEEALAKLDNGTITPTAEDLLKIWFLFLVCKREQTRNKNQFVTKFVGIAITIIGM